MPIPTSAPRRICTSLSDRPTVMIGCSFVKIRDARFLGSRGNFLFGCSSTRRCDYVAGSNNHFMDDSLHSIALRRELALFNRPLDEDVVAFLEGRRNPRKVAVERQVMPIGVLLRLALAILVSVTFPETDIRYRCSRRKVPDGRLRRQKPHDFETIPLHGYCSPC